MSVEVSTDGDDVILLQVSGPFRIPVTQWRLTKKEAKALARAIAAAAK